jgi:hypothetical protein
MLIYGTMITRNAAEAELGAFTGEACQWCYAKWKSCSRLAKMRSSR